MSALIRTTDELRRYAATEAREPLVEEQFRDRFSELLDAAPVGIVRHYAFFSLPADLGTWLDTGIEVPAGEAVTLFSTGWALPPEAEAQASAEERLWARVSLADEIPRGPWHRVGTAGEIMRGARSTHTFVAPHGGNVFLANRLIRDPGAAASETPQFDDDPAPPIERCALVVHWALDPLEGLETLRATGDVGGLLASEIARSQAVIELPDGWVYPATGGPWEQFTAVRTSDGPHIGCYSRDKTALLIRNVALPLVPGTRLRWRWKIDELPSRAREDRLETHDYLSIAVEFDNSTDLTYYWSAELPHETGYRCPIPGWGERETHVVVRSGTEGLGTWLEEERDLHADYVRYVGEPPANVRSVWLLTTTRFQGGSGQCEYDRIELDGGSTPVRLLN